MSAREGAAVVLVIPTEETNDHHHEFDILEAAR